MLCRSDEIDSEEDKDSLTLASIKSVTSVATGTVYSLMETAHPVFRKLRRFWNSPVESHKEVGDMKNYQLGKDAGFCRVLAT